MKSAMTVSAEIETARKDGVLIVPSSAVKTLNGRSFVEAFNPPLQNLSSTTRDVSSSEKPERIPVETGIVNDTETEIVSGLDAETQIILRAINSSTPAAQAPSLFGGGGCARGGAVRVNAR